MDRRPSDLIELVLGEVVAVSVVSFISSALCSGLGLWSCDMLNQFYLFIFLLLIILFFSAEFYSLCNYGSCV